MQKAALGEWEVMKLFELLQRATVHSSQKKYGRSSFGDVQELQKELFGTGRVLWGANAASHLKVLAPAGTQVANVNSLSSAGLVLPKKQPCLENTIKN